MNLKMPFQFNDVIQTLPEFHGLMCRDGTINSSLYFFNGSFASAVNKRSCIKSFPRVL